MSHAVVACGLASILAGCSGYGAAAPSSPNPAATTVAATLLARPLKLPVVQSAAACLVTPVASREVGIGSPRGKGPFYLGGPIPKGNFAWNKTVWVLVDGAQGPVLFRGGRVDGAGALMFSGNPADPSEKRVSLSSDGGVSAAFYQNVIDPGTDDAFYVYPATTGCYAIQVDGSTFEDVILGSAG